MPSLSKERKIQILLTIDTIFFFVELSTGYAVHSLALVADAFHMLNDVISLCVGLWAVKAASQTRSSMYTYGLQRAETLGALFNGIFLVALCVSIFLEAIQRLADPPEVKSPMLILIVGSWGLLSNILGLLLFHEHGHSHSHDHSHSPAGLTDRQDDLVVEEGMSTAVIASSSRSGSPKVSPAKLLLGAFRDSPASPGTPSASAAGNHGRTRSLGYGNLDDLPVHPASFRNVIINAGSSQNVDSALYQDNESDSGNDEDASEDTPLLYRRDSDVRDVDDQHSEHRAPAGPGHDNASGHRHGHGHSHAAGEHHHHHDHAAAKGGHGHSHGDLNMQGVFLHVLGDALGNIGVIASALFIMYSDSPHRFYADPIISLIITAIILASAIPLCKAASRILLQAVPVGISIDDIAQDILRLPGVLNCHDFHIWQLSDTKVVASLHVQIDLTDRRLTERVGEAVEVEDRVKKHGSVQYMFLARSIRQCFHAYGIHSTTIQPEFCSPVDPSRPALGDGDGHTLGLLLGQLSGPDGDAGEQSTRPTSAHPALSQGAVGAGGTTSREDGHDDRRSTASNGRTTPQSGRLCMLDCSAECGTGKQCCPSEGLDPASD